MPWLKTIHKYIYRQKMLDLKLAEQFHRISNDDLDNFDTDSMLSSIGKKETKKFDIRAYEKFPGGKVTIIKKDKKNG